MITMMMMMMMTTMLLDYIIINLSLFVLPVQSAHSGKSVAYADLNCGLEKDRMFFYFLAICKNDVHSLAEGPK